MSTIDLSNSRILVTGGFGFLGRWLIHVLRSEYGVPDTNIIAHRHTPVTNFVRSKHINLCSTNDIKDLFDEMGYDVDYVFHVAGYNGGIEFNRMLPADIFYINTIMGLNVIQGSVIANAKKVLSVVASCAYPTDEIEKSWLQTKEICKEQEFLNGPPHDSVACHGYAKRNLQLASYFANKQYGLNAVCACPTTLYGPGDSTDENKTKVLGAMIKRFLKAKRDNAESVTCWGSGKPLREFLYVEDAARMLVETMLHYDNSEFPLNLGSGHEISIRELANKVANAVGYTGRIEWDTSKPDGQFRKRLDITRMQEALGDNPLLTSLDDGIEKTVKWYASVI